MNLWWMVLPSGKGICLHFGVLNIFRVFVHICCVFNVIFQHLKTSFGGFNSWLGKLAGNGSCVQPLSVTTPLKRLSFLGVHHKHQPLRTMDKINPKDCQVLSLGDLGFLQFFRVVSSDYGKPRFCWGTIFQFSDLLFCQKARFVLRTLWMMNEYLISSQTFGGAGLFTYIYLPKLPKYRYFWTSAIEKNWVY